MKVLSVLYDGFCGIGEADDIIRTASELNRYEGRDCCVVLHGGTDIHPGLYAQAAHPYNQQAQNDRPMMRDMIEVAIVKHAIRLGIPIYGICRGAQLLCAIAGGSLFQHFTHRDGHNNGIGEMMHLYTGGTIMGNSCHHQLMDPTGTNHELLAWTEYKQTEFYRAGLEPVEGPDKQPEVVWFPDIKALAIQGHPEWLEGSEFTSFWNNEFITRTKQKEMCDA